MSAIAQLYRDSVVRSFRIGCAFVVAISCGGVAQAAPPHSAEASGYDIASSLVPSLRVQIDKAGIHFRSANGHHFGMRLLEYGYGGHMQPVRPIYLTSTVERVEIHYRFLTEWYRSTSSGLEQGFTLAAPPPVAAGRQFRLRIKLSGDLIPALRPHGGLVLYEDSGASLMRYGDLKVVDARGQRLPAQLYLVGNDLFLAFDDRAAVYPVKIDPLFSALWSIHGAWRPGASLLPCSDDGAATGASIAISDDMIIVGGPFACGNRAGQIGIARRLELGARWGWNGGATGPPGSEFGSAVAVNVGTIAVGAPGVDTDGAKDVGRVYVSSPGQPQSVELNIQYASGGERLGRALALDDDTLVAGAVGAVYAYQRHGGAFSGQLVQTLEPADGATGLDFGESVALEGNTVLVGAPGPNGGSVYVFTADVNGTFRQAEQLPAPDGASEFGQSVALDGGVALIGAPATGSGEVYVFVEGDDGFALHAVLDSPSQTPDARFGASVDINQGRGIIGAPGINKAYIYFRLSRDGSPSLVRTFSGKVSYDREVDARHFGSSVAIDGDEAAVGADELGQFHGQAFAVNTGINLSIAQRRLGDGTVDQGDKITFVATAVNHDPALTAHHVTVSFFHFYGDEYVSPPPVCKLNIWLDCDLGALGPGMSREVSITVKTGKNPYDSVSTLGYAVHVRSVEGDQNFVDNNKDVTDVTIRNPSWNPPPQPSPPPSQANDGGGGAIGLLWLLVLVGASLWPQRLRSDSS
ncbi:MAG TPA: FG-GAP repeat protein [Gammaproteobacteria bacterium]|nr:FG-GAP repeat protein [Gammaproteobacteria bacterium]